MEGTDISTKNPSLLEVSAITISNAKLWFISSEGGKSYMGPGRLQTQKEASGKSWHQYLIHYKWNVKTKEKLVAVD
jgi:hypothetical protein